MVARGSLGVTATCSERRGLVGQARSHVGSDGDGPSRWQSGPKERLRKVFALILKVWTDGNEIRANKGNRTGRD